MKKKLGNFFPIKKNNFLIFLFHGVIKKNLFSVRNYNNKHILEKKFIKILSFLKKNGNALSIDELCNRIRNNIDLPKNTYLITFDDGFENNYSIAAPILKHFKIPAIFYFSSDFVENNSVSWIDKIEYCLEKTSKGTLSLPWSKKKFFFNNRKKKIQILENIRRHVKNDFSINITELINSIFFQCNMKVPNKLYSNIDKKINWKKVNKLNEHHLFTIGGHSHEHLSFGSLTKKQIDFQIIQSFKLFKKNTRLNLKHYSYPEGQKKDFNSYVIKKLRSKKIICCPSALDGINKINTDFFKLKRKMI